MRPFECVDAELRHAEIGCLACDFDIAKEKAHVRDINVEHGRLDIDRHVGLGHFALGDERAERAHAGADAAPWLTALLVADESKKQGRLDRKPRPNDRSRPLRASCRGRP